MIKTIEYSSTYPYMHFGKLLQPRVTVQLVHGKQRMRVVALIDTGADYSVFDLEIAETLDIDLTVSQQLLSGLGGRVECRQGKVYLKFGPLVRFIECSAFFVEGLKKHCPNLLGRIPAFEQVQIGFDEMRHEVYMALNT